MSLDPRGASAQRGYAALLAAQRRASEAVAAAHNFVEADPLSVLSWITLGSYLQASGDLGGSRESLNQALQLAPTDLARFELGMTEALDGHPEVALDLFRQIRFKPGRLFGIALSEQALRQRRESELALQQLIGGVASACLRRRSAGGTIGSGSCAAVS
jgi:tetratricopeptide (TPR) repeat protein